MVTLDEQLAQVMMLTEEEARKKWCPFVRYYEAGDRAASNRWRQSLPAEEPHALNPVPCRCIASDCMMWQWFDHQKGYCGLARSKP